MRCHFRLVAWLASVALWLSLARPAGADLLLEVSVVPQAGSMFEYAMTLVNNGTDGLSGLNILNANSVFGLTSASTITAPPGWSFFPPEFGVDELNYFSQSSASDAQIGEALSGFSFVSSVDPSTLQPGSFQADAILSSSSEQTALIPIVFTVPEPGTLQITSLVLATAAVGCHIRTRRRIP